MLGFGKSKDVSFHNIDIVVADDEPPKRLPSVAFQFFKTNPATVQAWQQASQLFQESSKQRQRLTESSILKRVFASRNLKLQIRYMPSTVVVDSKWFNPASDNLRSPRNAAIVNSKLPYQEDKVQRSKDYGLWFLDLQEKRCATPIPVEIDPSTVP